MALNSLFCADVPLSNYSLAPFRSILHSCFGHDTTFDCDVVGVELALVFHTPQLSAYVAWLLLGSKAKHIAKKMLSMCPWGMDGSAFVDERAMDAKVFTSFNSSLTTTPPQLRLIG